MEHVMITHNGDISSFEGYSQSKAKRIRSTHVIMNRLLLAVILLYVFSSGVVEKVFHAHRPGPVLRLLVGCFWSFAGFGYITTKAIIPHHAPAFRDMPEDNKNFTILYLTLVEHMGAGYFTAAMCSFLFIDQPSSFLITVVPHNILCFVSMLPVKLLTPAPANVELIGTMAFTSVLGSLLP